ncbi:hypothetical protein [Sphingomonas sp. 3-13AW]|uniref:hypothetical protein n=1 Tax=Sphingomonas sp. 3-13AW TaxID=3050450 RepID=UPI003BB6F7A0
MKPLLLALLGTAAMFALSGHANAQTGQSVTDVLECEEENTPTPTPAALDPGLLPIDDIVTGGGSPGSGTGGGSGSIPGTGTGGGAGAGTGVFPGGLSPDPAPNPAPPPGGGSGAGSAQYMSNPNITNMRVGGDGDPRTYMAGPLNTAYRQDLAAVKTYPAPKQWADGETKTIDGQKILVKPGVSVAGLSSNIVSIIDELNLTAAALGLRSPVVTSTKDSKHGTGSKHYSGAAIDVRCNNANGYTDTQCKQWVVALANALGPKYDVIFEDFDGDSNHVHIEYDPK